MISLIVFVVLIVLLVDICIFVECSVWMKLVRICLVIYLFDVVVCVRVCIFLLMVCMLFLCLSRMFSVECIIFLLSFVVCMSSSVCV